jgi:hypothetical protein
MKDALINAWGYVVIGLFWLVLAAGGILMVAAMGGAL